MFVCVFVCELCRSQRMFTYPRVPLYLPGVVRGVDAMLELSLSPWCIWCDRQVASQTRLPGSLNKLVVLRLPLSLGTHVVLRLNCDGLR